MARKIDLNLPGRRRLEAALEELSQAWSGGPNHVLVDWDTVALAPRERDLWMFVGDIPEGATIYTDATGHELDEVAVNFFRLTWDLADIAAFTHQLRLPHEHSEDTEKAYDALTYYVATRDRWAALLD